MVEDKGPRTCRESGTGIQPAEGGKALGRGLAERAILLRRRGMPIFMALTGCRPKGNIFPASFIGLQSDWLRPLYRG